MIESFADKTTQKLFEGSSPKRFRSFQAQAERKLQLLDSATHCEFLRSPPGNHLEKLTGNRSGQYSIRINKQYRLCCSWDDNQPNPSAVELTDYH
ncbi:MAG TPA: excinuclease ABC subunit A [Oceanospirillaceae bacterium]|nr:excinuclease ABC subunit A [Oceanospirillaceae bacterium]